MLTPHEAELRVAKGAAHLDAIRPGWFHRIDVGTLTLLDPCGCVVGQLCGSDYFFVIGLKELRLTCGPDGTGVRFGFDVRQSDCDDAPFPAFNRPAFALLQDAWIAAIADRKLKDSASWSTTPARSQEERTTKS